MTVESLRSQLDALDQAALYVQENFRGRAEAIDAIEFAIIDRIDGLLGDPTQPQELRSLRREAQRLQRRLEAVDELLFQSLRSAIRDGCRGEALRQAIDKFAGIAPPSEWGQAVVGYDGLDRGGYKPCRDPRQTRDIAVGKNQASYPFGRQHPGNGRTDAACRPSCGTKSGRTAT